MDRTTRNTMARKNRWRELPVALAAIVVMSAHAAGCAVRSGANEARIEAAVTLPDDTDWPVRHLEPLLNIAHSTPDERRPLTEQTPRAILERTIGSAYPFARPVMFRGAFGVGVVTEDVEERTPDTRAYRVLTTRMDAESFERASTDQPLQDVVIDVPCLLYEAATPRPRGLLVHLSSISRHSAYEMHIMRELRRRGFAIIEIGHPTSLRIDQRIAHMEGSNIEYSVRAAAESIDSRIADWVYATESMLEYLTRARSDFAHKPVVLTGYSLGAMVLPAVAARMPGAFDAAVIVTGGANILYVLAHPIMINGEPYSGVSIWRASPSMEDVLTVNGKRYGGISLKDLERMSADEVHAITPTYLRYSKLDPYHTAAALRGTPVLMLHAMFDDIIPAETGRMLYERLGRPERWSYPFGHLGLFWWLPNEAGRIAAWIEKQIE